jgi:hypothetical protein
MDFISPNEFLLSNTRRILLSEFYYSPSSTRVPFTPLLTLAADEAKAKLSNS